MAHAGRLDRPDRPVDRPRPAAAGSLTGPEYHRYRAEPPGRRRSPWPALAAIAGLLAVVAVVVLLVVPALSGEDPEEAVDAFLADWSRGDDRAAAEATDQPRAALAAFAANRKGLDKARLSARRRSAS